MSAPQPKIKVTYDNVDITNDITNGLVSFVYKDKVTGETDELEIQVEDIDGKWKNDWYPQKGAKLTAQIGYDDNMTDCGVFKIDEVQFTGPPDTIHIRATAITKPGTKTKNSKANENITLRQLAAEIAKKHDLTLDDGTKTVHLKRPDTKEEQVLISKLAAFARKQGLEKDNAIRYLSVAALQVETFKVIRRLEKKGYNEEADLLVADCRLVAANMTQENCSKFAKFASEIQIRLIKSPLEYDKKISLGLNKITLERSTQYQEGDLAYLARIAEEYGFAFSVKGDVMVFYNIKSLEGSPSNATLNKTEFKGYDFVDKISETFKDVNVKSHNSSKNELVESSVSAEDLTAENGDNYQEVTGEESLEIKVRSENSQQAEMKGKAALHKHNSRILTGSFSIIGNPLVVAGNNVDISDFGKMSGKWHTTESTHTVTKSSGYVTSFEAKRVARFTGDGSTKKAATGAKNTKRGDTTKEEDLLKILAASAYNAGKINDNDQRSDSAAKIITNGEKIVKLLYGKNCSKEAKQLQSNCEMLRAYSSKENAFLFSKYCQEIRIELIKAKK
jgi:phage protein D